jgi:hypothetical protein
MSSFCFSAYHDKKGFHTMGDREMADGGDQGAVPLSNSAARHEVIRRAMREVSQLEAKRKAINADIKEVKNRLIKGDLGYQLEDWKLLQRFYDSEQAQRDATIDTLREGFAALNIGEQLNWVATVEASKRPAPPPGESAASNEEINLGVASYNQGRQAGLRGETGADNPWPEGVKAHATWERGWVAGQTELAKGPALGATANGGDESSAPEAVPVKRGRGRPRGPANKRLRAGADLLN